MKTERLLLMRYQDDRIKPFMDKGGNLWEYADIVLEYDEGYRREAIDLLADRHSDCNIFRMGPVTNGAQVNYRYAWDDAEDELPPYPEAINDFRFKPEYNCGEEAWLKIMEEAKKDG